MEKQRNFWKAGSQAVMLRSGKIRWQRRFIGSFQNSAFGFLPFTLEKINDVRQRQAKSGQGLDLAHKKAPVPSRGSEMISFFCRMTSARIQAVRFSLKPFKLKIKLERAIFGSKRTPKQPSKKREALSSPKVYVRANS